MKKKHPSSKEKSKVTIIVGIGASAGGLEAFSELLKHLPPDTGMSFVFIQHLEPKHESKLPEILSRVTSIPVKQITGKVKPEPNHIYVIPPDKYLEIKNRTITLTERRKRDGVHLPIDYFFQSLAGDLKDKAIGIILSGTASDGTIGLASIKSEGGLTFAQDQESSKYPGMPKSAADSGYVDFVLPPARIAKELMRIGKHPHIMHNPPVKKSVKKIREQINYEDSVNSSLKEIFKDLYSFSGVDFSHYKLSTVMRRVNRRMVLSRKQDLKDYSGFIKSDKYEVKKLYSDLLINVTSFFRDPEVYKTLNRKIFPRLAKKAPDTSVIRIWVIGCSTGEEVYSLAISLREFIERKSLNLNFQIFATDISDMSIEKARAGIFQESALKEIPADIRNKYFIKSNGLFQINKSLRDRCIFARHDLIKDPPYSRVDLISCRNLLIYLSGDLQKKIIPLFHYSLNPDSFLILGASETIGSSGNLFQLIDIKNKIYKKKLLDKKIDYNFSLPRTHGDKTENKRTLVDNPDIMKEADALILSQFAPAGVVINQNLDIIQFRGNIKEYLDPAQGNASLNLFKMIKEGMNVELHSSITQAARSKKAAVYRNIRINKNGTYKEIDLEVIPLKTSFTDSEKYYLLLFLDKNNESAASPGKEGSIKKKRGKYSDAGIEKLKEELGITREHLQSIIEERERANEELKSALEELQSSNEELQSTNEEMETAREELQSTNEELMTTNDELEVRNNELNVINNDLNNLLASINTAIILLGRDLKIRRFTLKAETVWNLIPSDIGRPISNLKPNFEVKNIEALIFEVMENLESKEVEVRDINDRYYSMKIRPYKTMDGKIDGAVISLYNVDARTRAMELMTEEKDFYKSVLNTVRQPLLVLDEELNVQMANDAFYNSFHNSEGETVGRNIYLINNRRWDTPDVRQLIGSIMPGTDSAAGYDVPVNLNGKRGKTLILNARRIEFLNGAKKLILLSVGEDLREKVNG